METKSNQNKAFKIKLQSKRSLLPSKSGKFTPHCHQRGIPDKAYPNWNKVIWMKNSAILFSLPSSISSLKWQAARNLFGLATFEVKLFGKYWKSLTVPREWWSIFFRSPFFVVCFPLYAFFFFLTAAFLITVSQWLYCRHLLIVNQPIPWRQRAIVEVVSNLFCSMDFLLCMHAKPLLSHI